MAAKPIRKLVVKTGEYIDNLTGRNKGRWLQVGVMFKHDDGNCSIKLEAMPVGKDFDGWISLFPIDDPQQPQAQPAQQTAPPRQTNSQPAYTQHNRSVQQLAAPAPAIEDDIPF